MKVVAAYRRCMYASLYGPLLRRGPTFNVKIC